MILLKGIILFICFKISVLLFSCFELFERLLMSNEKETNFFCVVGCVIVLAVVYSMNFIL